MSMNSDLISLKKLLTKLEKDRLKANDHLSYDLQDPLTFSNISKLKTILDKYGVLFIYNCLTPSQITQLKQDVLTVHNKMYQSDNIKANTIEEIPIIAKAGVMGNKTFGYLYKQPEDSSQAHQTEISLSSSTPANPQKEKVYFTQCPAYYDINLQILGDPQNQKLKDILLGVTHPTKKTMISWDSCKVSTFGKAGVNLLTKSHLDWYHNSRERYQVILNPVEGMNKLFYCPHTNNQQVQQLLIKITGKKNLYTKDGFVALDDQLVDVIRPFCVAPEANSLAFWKAGVIHGEFRSENKSNKDHLYHPTTLDYSKALKDQLTVRMVIGNHIPIGLSSEALEELIIMAKYGFIPHRYLHGNHQEVVDNKMHKGKTLYKKYRFIAQSEKTDFQKVEFILQDKTRKKINQELQTIPQSILDLVGL